MYNTFNSWVTFFSLLLFAYFLGSIPFGIVFGKLLKIGDIRKIGSGNIGATNALRSGSKRLAALTLLFDLLKGSFAPLLAVFVINKFPKLIPSVVTSWLVCLLSLAVILGHIFSIFLHFKGGKGVATSLGVFLILSPMTFLFGVSIWLIGFWRTRISSLSALFAFCVAIPLHCGGLWWLERKGIEVFVLSIIIALVLVFTHRENVKRLVSGKEATFF